jgi:hypothetical protein
MKTTMLFFKIVTAFTIVFIFSFTLPAIIWSVITLNYNNYLNCINDTMYQGLSGIFTLVMLGAYVLHLSKTPISKNRF